MAHLIRSARLQLIPFIMADAEEVYACITPAVARFMAWEPPGSLAEYKAARKSRLQANDPSDFTFVVRRNDTLECLGIAGLHEVDQPMPELGIWLKEAVHGQGYGREAVRAVAEWATKSFGKESFLYPVAVQNVRSRRIAETLNGEIIGTHAPAQNMTRLSTKSAHNQIRVSVVASDRLPALFMHVPEGGRRFWEFFTVNIRNPNTRRAYFKAVEGFAAWCEDKGLGHLSGVTPMHVAGYVEQLGRTHSKPTVKQHLAAIRMLFDWLVTGHIMQTNPAHAVRGPKHSVKKGKTSVLSAEEMHELLAAIDTSSLLGLRDRALIALMGYTFARVGAAVGMKVEDFYVQKRRGWVRLHEKGGKVTELPCHHNLDQYLEEWISVSGLGSEPEAPLFPTLPHGRLIDRTPLPQPNVHMMIQRRARAAGLRTKISAHSFRATGITTYLRNGGKLEIAQHMAGHESARTTGLYDRRSDEIALDEVERIAY